MASASVTLSFNVWVMPAYVGSNKEAGAKASRDWRTARVHKRYPAPKVTLLHLDGADHFVSSAAFRSDRKLQNNSVDGARKNAEYFHKVQAPADQFVDLCPFSAVVFPKVSCCYLLDTR